MYKWYRVVFVFLYLAYFTYQNALQFHSCFRKWQDFLLFKGWIIFHCVCVFHTLAIVSNAAVNLGVQVSLWDNVFISFGNMPRIGIAGCCRSSIFNFLRKLHSVSHGDYTSLHSYQQCTRVPFSLCSHQCLSSLVSFIIAILTVVRWYIVVFDLHFPDD